MSSSKQPLSQDTVEAIVSAFALGHSKRQIARDLKLSDSTVRKYLEKHGLDAFQEASNPTDLNISMGRQIARQADTIRVLRNQVKKVNERGYGYDDFVDALRTFVSTEKLKPLTYFPTQIEKAKKLAPIPAIDPKHAEIIALALSDWHVTEVVRLEDSNGINQYNSVIAANRLYTIVQKFKQIFQIHRAAYGIKKIWLPTLGDMISGSVHEEFLTSNDTTDQVAQLLCLRLFEMLVLELKSLGVPIEIDCVVGNHARTTKKVVTKNLAHTSLEWVIYMMLQHIFKDDDQVKVNVHTSQLALVNQFDHRYVLEHGIDWKNTKEEAFEDAIRSLLDDPVYRKATGLKGSAFDQIVIGNLHKGAFMERTIKNASLIGQNELGQQWRLKPIKAQQLMWGISQSHVRTFGYGLDVTEVKSSKADNPFSEFAREFLKDHGRYQAL